MAITNSYLTSTKNLESIINSVINAKLYCKTHASIVWHGNKLIFQAQFIQDRLNNV